MAISLLDINAGDTIQSMVQKINYNFDQIQANGGGPQGEQGEQGIQGATGERGETGEQGIRGSRWYTIVNNAATSPDPEVFPPQNNDMGIDSGGNVYIYQTNTWTQTGMTITEIASSAFVGGGYDSIEANENYTDYKLILGTTSGQMSENIGTNPSLAININTQEGATAHTDGLEFYTDGISNSNLTGWISVLPEGNDSILLHINAKNGIEITSNVGSNNNENSIILESNTKKIKFSAFENVAPADTTVDDITASINPLLVTNHDGELSTGEFSSNTYGYKWCVENNTAFGGAVNITTLRPNVPIGTTASQSINSTQLGTESYPISTMHLGALNSTEFGINAKTPTIYVKGYSSNDYDMFIAKESSAYPTVGILENNHLVVGFLSANPSTDTIPYFGNTATPIRSGMTIRGDNFGSMLCFTSNPLSTPAMFSGKLVDTITDTFAYISQPVTHAYKVSLGNSEYGRGSVITEKSNCTDKIYDQLSIKGGYTNGSYPAGSVSISGGRGYTVDKRGGDVYISGGDNLSLKPNSNDTNIQYDAFRFGDVVIGINPDNHEGYYTDIAGANDEYAAYRGTNDYKSNDNGMPFYDINNFTAHASNIWLDSDAQSRAMRGNIYSMTEYPTISNPKHLTFNVGGLCTLHHGRPILLSQGDMYRYQMLSGKMCFVATHYSTATVTQSFLYSIDINDRKQIGVPLYDNTLVSLYETEWTKIGNLVQCHTKINNYIYRNNTYYPVYNGQVVPNTNHQFKNSMITDIPLPVVAGNSFGGTNVNCVNGYGVVFTESADCSTSVGFEAIRTLGEKVTNVVFEYGALMSDFSYYDTTNGNFETLRHNRGGAPKMTNPVGSSNSYPSDYAKRFSFDTSTNSSIDYSNFLAGCSWASIVPNYMFEYNTTNHHYKSLPLNRLYTTGNFSFSYMINSEFNSSPHTPFYPTSDGSSNINMPTEDEIGSVIHIHHSAER